MKNSFRLLCAALGCLLLTPACTTPARHQLRMLSYNIRNGIGTDGVQDLNRTGAAITAIAPDIVALQEVDSVTGRSAGRFIPAELEQMTGLHATFGRAIDFDGGGYGIGLLSREKPLAVRRIPLPGREEARLLLLAEFPDYIVGVTHLSLTAEDQITSLGIIRRATDTCRKPVLLAGDFNIDRPSEVFGGLGDTFRPLSDTTQMTFPADNPQTCIDYIAGHGLPEQTVVEQCVADHTITASDHSPLWVDLAW